MNNSKFAAAQKVDYEKDYPPLLIYQRESYLKMLLIKSDVWAYEKEFRLICPHFTDVKNNPLIMDGNYLSIGPDDLKSVIVGCQASDDTITSIRTMVKEYAPNIAVRRAVRAANRYRLVIEG